MLHPLLLLIVSFAFMAIGCAVCAADVPTTNPADDITITHPLAKPPAKASPDYFTGDVQVSELFAPREPSRVSCGSVTFAPGARSAWHTHPVGQTLVVTAGVGRVQIWGGPIKEFRSGDVVSIPPGVKHWHGASPTSSMTHLAIQEAQNGKAVVWLEHVTDEQYNSTPATQQSTTATSAIQITQPNVAGRRLSPDDVQRVAPALEQYTQERLYGEVWNRPGLSKRDRSIVTVSAMIARSQTAALTYYFGQAIDNGVKPSEISEIITHLAFYSGWGNAVGAIGAAKDVFTQRGIAPDQLPAANVELLPLDEAAEATRAAGVEANFGAVSPGVVQYTTDPLFRELWQRPGLAPRDRSLVTVSALIALGQTAQITYHLNRAMDKGLTQEEASETLTQLAFYMGWPNVFSAMPVVKDVFEKRPK